MGADPLRITNVGPLDDYPEAIARRGLLMNRLALGWLLGGRFLFRRRALGTTPIYLSHAGLFGVIQRGLGCFFRRFVFDFLRLATRQPVIIRLRYCCQRFFCLRFLGRHRLGLGDLWAGPFRWAKSISLPISRFEGGDGRGLFSVLLVGIPREAGLPQPVFGRGIGSERFFGLRRSPRVQAVDRIWVELSRRRGFEVCFRLVVSLGWLWLFGLRLNFGGPSGWLWEFGGLDLRRGIRFIPPQAVQQVFFVPQVRLVLGALACAGGFGDHLRFPCRGGRFLVGGF